MQGVPLLWIQGWRLWGITLACWFFTIQGGRLRTVSFFIIKYGPFFGRQRLEAPRHK